MLHVAALILGCPTVGPPPTRGLSPVVGWVYGDDGTTMPTDSVQKATWEAFGEACVKGRSQSPINICTKSTQRLAKGSPSLHIHLQDEKMLPMNSGHNFELTIVDGQEKLYADVEGDKLQFMQVHWHAPAENTVDGSYAAMEAHFVHQGPSDELAVVALRYRITEQCNPHLARFWDSFPIVEGTAESDVPAVPLGMLLSPKLLAGGYYRWDGSLTTPPCTEGVRWFLLKEEATVCEVSSHPPHPHPTRHPPHTTPKPTTTTITVATTESLHCCIFSPASTAPPVPVQAQVQSLRKTLREMQGVNYNSRAIQPLNNRTVFELEFDKQAEERWK